MRTGNHVRAIWVAAFAAVCAWPLGQVIGLALSAGQGGPGAALAGSIGDFITVGVWLAATTFVVWKPRKRLGQLDRSRQAIVLVLVAFLPAAMVLSSANSPTYSVRIWNQSEARLDQVTVQISGGTFTVGVLGPGASKEVSSRKDSLTGTAIITWSSNSIEPDQNQFDLSEIVPRIYNDGVLTFTIAGDGKVDVGFYKERRSRYR